MSRDPIRDELRGLDAWLTREEKDDLARKEDAARKPFLLQSKIEDAIIAFFRAKDAYINETTIGSTGTFDAYALAVAIERVVDETMAEQP